VHCDFIILGPTQKAVNAAFKRALKLLSAHGLEAYDPHMTPEKAETGGTDSKFSFLGCDIMPGMIQPGVKTRNRLISSVDELQLDSNVDKLIFEYLEHYGHSRQRHMHAGMVEHRRRLLGVHLLNDSKKCPILRTSESTATAA